MEQKQKVIDELNRFLKGRYMGMEQYEQLMKQTKDMQLKQMLQKFHDQTKQEANQVAQRIIQLGGKPVQGIGLIGELREWMKKLKTNAKPSEEILHDAFKGENKYGIHYSHHMVAGDLDEQSKQLIDRILEQDQQRADQIKSWLSSLQQI